MDKETEKSIQELQMLEQSLQNLLMQKQAFQMELNETENASSELDKAKDEVYKIAGQIMIRSSKEALVKELDEKKHLLSLRLNAIEKQEAPLTEKATKLRDEIVSKISESRKEK